MPGSSEAWAGREWRGLSGPGCGGGVVTVGGALIVYGMAVGFGGPAGFRRAAWPLRAPRLGAVALVAVAWSVPVAFLLAGLTVVAAGERADRRSRATSSGACLGRLRAAYATPAGAGIVTAGQVLTAGILARGGWAVVRVVRRRRDERRRHRLLVRLAARRAARRARDRARPPRRGGLRGGGSGGRTVVVTRGIVDLLTGPELSAVLAHENAHLAAVTIAGRPPRSWSLRRCRSSRCCGTPRPGWAGSSRWTPTTSPPRTTNRG